MRKRRFYLGQREWHSSAIPTHARFFHLPKEGLRENLEKACINRLLSTVSSLQRIKVSQGRNFLGSLKSGEEITFVRFLLLFHDAFLTVHCVKMWDNCE
jgi:hypothetical protein